MTERPLPICLLFIFLFSSCQNRTTTQNVDLSPSLQTGTRHEPNYNYIIKVPEDWTIRDTIMQGGLRIRMLFSPPSLKADYPAGNVLIASMEGQNIDNFVTRNMDYLKANMPNITILERGNIDSTIYNGQWYTYTREQNEVVRNMINYIIPLNGFAYMITCGANKGSMNKYRETFDNIAKSFSGY